MQLRSFGPSVISGFVVKLGETRGHYPMSTNHNASACLLSDPTRET